MLIENFFIQENVFEYVVWKMSAILSRPQCVEHLAKFMVPATVQSMVTTCSSHLADAIVWFL